MLDDGSGLSLSLGRLGSPGRGLSSGRLSRAGPSIRGKRVSAFRGGVSGRELREMRRGSSWRWRDSVRRDGGGSSSNAVEGWLRGLNDLVLDLLGNDCKFAARLSQGLDLKDSCLDSRLL